MRTILSVYSGTSLFQSHLGPAKVAGLVRWLDLRVGLLCETYIGRSIRAKAIGCFSEVAAFQRLGLVRFHCSTYVCVYLLGKVCRRDETTGVCVTEVCYTAWTLGVSSTQFCT